MQCMQHIACCIALHPQMSSCKLSEAPRDPGEGRSKALHILAAEGKVCFERLEPYLLSPLKASRTALDR